MGEQMKIKAGTIVKVRDFRDEGWELGWYIEYHKEQQAHKVTMEKPIRTESIRLYNYATPVWRASK
jgi:hypothetical protein